MWQGCDQNRDSRTGEHLPLTAGARARFPKVLPKYQLFSDLEMVPPATCSPAQEVVLQVQTPVTWPATRIMRNCAAQRGCCWPWCSLVVIMLKVESNGLNVSTKTDLAPPAACSAACSSWKWGKSLNFLTH